MFSKRSVVLSWACSYIGILLIPMIAIFVIHYFNIQVVEKEVVRVNEQALTNLQEYVDQILEDEVDMFNYIYLNDNFDKLLRADKKDKYFYDNVDKLKNTLTTYRANDTKLTGMICFVNQDYVLDANAGANSRIIYNSYEFTSKQEIDYEDWIERMSQAYKGEFFISDNLRRNSSTDQIIYANSVTYFKGKRANVFVFFPVSEITKLTENSTNQILLETDGEYILYVSGGKQMPIPENIETDETGKLMLAGEDYVCLSKTSSVGNLTYKMLIPEQEIKAESLHVRNVLLICVVLAVILSGLCVTILLRRNVRPLITLLNKLGAKEIKGNEYVQIERIYNTVSQQNLEMQKEMFKKDQRIQNSELLDLLKGRTGDYTEGRVLAGLQEGKEFCLVGFKVPLHDQAKLQHDENLYFVIDNVFSELVNSWQFYKAHDGQHIFFLFVLDKGQEAGWRQNCVELAKFLCNLIEDKTGVQIIAAVGGNYVEKLEELRFLYREVVEGFAYTAIIGGSGVIDLAELYLEDMQLDFMVTVELAMQKETSEEMLKSVTKIFSELDSSPLHVVQVQLLEIFQKLLQYVYKYASDERKKREFFECLEALLEVKTKEKAKQVLKDTLLCAYQAVGFHREKPQNSIVQKTKEYVEQHYSDPKLNVKDMAVDLGWNQTYMARVFREETNEGILEYINRVRISKAVVLLNSTKLSMEEVSEQVGYVSSNTFRRVFKQKMGMSPNKYKPGGRNE